MEGKRLLFQGVVSMQEHGMPLLAFLKKQCSHEGLSARKLKQLINEKSCLVNGRVEFFSSYLLMEGDRVELVSFEASFLTALSILFEDEYFILLDKPAKMVCEEEFFKKRGWILAHRLDKDTSGVLFLAKSMQAKEAAKELFIQRSISKLYLALVFGKVKEKKGVIESFLGKKGSYQGQTLYGEVNPSQGLKAITHFEVLCSNSKASLLLCDLKTGRTHQIRVHLSARGHPLLGDSQYAQGAFTEHSLFHVPRHLLHAWKLSFIHPFSHQIIRVEAPIPPDFQKAIESIFLRLTG